MKAAPMSSQNGAMMFSGAVAAGSGKFWYPVSCDVKLTNPFELMRKVVKLAP